MAPQTVVVGEVDKRAVEQMQRCADAGDAIASAVCADGHVGYSQPIGGVLACEDFISPSGVGYDIGCGNKAVATNLQYSDISGDLPKIMDEIAAKISFGMGVPNEDKIDHPILDKILTDAPFQRIKDLQPKAAKQLGTVGGGNHYVDLFRDEYTDRVWIGVHFGSRGFGHTIASGFLAMAQNLPFGERAPEGEMDSAPVLLHADSPLAHAYIEAMHLAGEYAYAGRNVVCSKVLSILGAAELDSVHNHHNFAWRETHFGRKVWVIRKGCTPAFPGQRGFVGATMGETSVILQGGEAVSGDWSGPGAGVVEELQRNLLFSTVHGAGRLMSRTAAAGKKRKRWSCCNRDCSWVQEPFTHKPEDGNCPTCGHGRLQKRWIQETDGLVDWDLAMDDLKMKNIELRGAAADEAPLAYKRLDDVLAYHGATVEVTHRLRPIGVAMAGPGVEDKYKD